MEANGEPPKTPNLGPLEWYGKMFLKMGRVSNNGMGLQPLLYSEIQAMGAIECLDREDMQTIREMSEAYMRGYRNGANALQLPPWKGEDLWQT